MSNELMKTLVKSEGHCCMFGFMRVASGRNLRPVAERYGVSPQALRKWRDRYRRGQLHCEKCSNCSNSFAAPGTPPCKVSSPQTANREDRHR